MKSVFMRIWNKVLRDGSGTQSESTYNSVLFRDPGWYYEMELAVK